VVLDAGFAETMVIDNDSRTRFESWY
jgi:hypothetical protein